MQTHRAVLINLCDFCPPNEPKDVEYNSFKCDNCGKMACRDHRSMLIELRGYVYHYGKADAKYCEPCLATLKAAKDPRVMALLKVQELREEEKTWSASFAKRHVEAEVACESFAK